MYKKIVHFIKYHNAFTLIIVFVLFFTSLSLASQDFREGVLLGKEEREFGVDNAVLLTTDIDAWNFEPMILDIEEDNEYYYVTYKFKTLGVKDNIWQELWRENLLKFEKESDRYTDVASYITKEIGEVVQHEYQLLKDSQKIARENGRTQRVKVVAYNGLVGKVLNLKEKVILQENPLITEEAIQLAQQTFQENQNQSTCSDCKVQDSGLNKGTIDKELIRKIVEEILNEKIGRVDLPEIQEPTTTPPATSCQPNWQCGDWQPAIDESLCGQTITQTRTCHDTNNCKIEEGKPAESQTITTPACPESTPPNNTLTEP